MALNFDLREIPQETRTFFVSEEDKKEGIGYRRPKTEALIWLSMILGIDELTKKNVDEWWWRICFLHTIDSPYFSIDKSILEKYKIPCSPWEVTKGDLIQHIGLKTNVTTFTRHKFCTNQLDTLKDRTDRDAKSDYPCGLVKSEEVENFNKAFSAANKAWEEQKQNEAKAEAC